MAEVIPTPDETGPEATDSRAALAAQTVAINIKAVAASTTPAAQPRQVEISPGFTMEVPPIPDNF